MEGLDFLDKVRDSFSCESPTYLTQFLNKIFVTDEPSLITEWLPINVWISNFFKKENIESINNSKLNILDFVQMNASGQSEIASKD